MYQSCLCGLFGGGGEGKGAQIDSNRLKSTQIGLKSKPSRNETDAEDAEQ